MDISLVWLLLPPPPSHLPPLITLACISLSVIPSPREIPSLLPYSLQNLRSLPVSLLFHLQNLVSPRHHLQTFLPQSVFQTVPLPVVYLKEFLPVVFQKNFLPVISVTDPQKVPQPLLFMTSLHQIVSMRPPHQMLLMTAPHPVLITRVHHQTFSMKALHGLLLERRHI